MRIGIIGLGRMGHAIAKRVVDAGHVVFGYDVNADAMKHAQEIGVHTVTQLERLAQEIEVFWLMLPAGKLIDQMIDLLEDRLHPESIIVDGGNSFYKDSIARAERLKKKNISFLDCGTSGGLLGEQIGFSLMIGGNEQAYQQMLPIWQAVAMKDGYAHIGPSGTGHYVKMVHNGIEYALLQAYAEGFQIIKEGHFKNDAIDLAKLSDVWMHGAIIRSYILELAHQIFTQDQKLLDISGEIAESGTGAWTAQEAAECNIPAPMVQEALKQRALSRVTGGNYATKIVAMLRHAFGGHAVQVLSESKKDKNKR